MGQGSAKTSELIRVSCISTAAAWQLLWEGFVWLCLGKTSSDDSFYHFKLTFYEN